MAEREEKLSRISRKLRTHEYNIDNLEMLIFIKKGYIYKHKKEPKDEWKQTDLQQQAVNKGVCPFCLNLIDWDKLDSLIIEHKKAIVLLNKELDNTDGE